VVVQIVQQNGTIIANFKGDSPVAIDFNAVKIATRNVSLFKCYVSAEENYSLLKVYPGYIVTYSFLTILE
jgi:hypothetical protein